MGDAQVGEQKGLFVKLDLDLLHLGARQQRRRTQRLLQSTAGGADVQYLQVQAQLGRSRVGKAQHGHVQATVAQAQGAAPWHAVHVGGHLRLQGAHRARADALNLGGFAQHQSAQRKLQLDVAQV